MELTLSVETKVLGQKKAGDCWPMPLSSSDSEQLLLRDLIARIVRAQVAAFQQRQEARRFIRVLTAAEIQRGVAQGKVDMGGQELQQHVEPDLAVAAAWQAFEDGLYLVFVDDEQLCSLDSKLRFRPDSRLTFLRLTPLAGG